MKRKIIDYTMLLLLIGCSTMAVRADSEADANPVTDLKPPIVINHNEAPVLKTRLGFKSSGRWFSGQVVNLDLFAYNLQDILKFRMDVKYNPEHLRLVYVSRGAFLVEEQGLAEWNGGVIDNQNGRVVNISGIRSRPFSGNETTLIRLNFIVIGAGSGEISLDNPKIVSSNGIERDFDFTPLQYLIDGEMGPR